MFKNIIFSKLKSENTIRQSSAISNVVPRAQFTNCTSPATRVRVNPHTPVMQKVADEVVFRRFQGEGVEFFLNRTSLTPSDF